MSQPLQVRKEPRGFGLAFALIGRDGWFVLKTEPDRVEALDETVFAKGVHVEAVDRFYRAYYLRPKPILRIIKTMLEDKDVFVRRCREGYEFFKSLKQRKVDLAAAQAAAA